MAIPMPGAAGDEKVLRSVKSRERPLVFCGRKPWRQNASVKALLRSGRWEI